MKSSRLSVLAISLALLGAAPGARAQQKEIALIGPGSLRLPINELSASFEKKTGDKVALTMGTGGVTKAQILKGVPFDVVIVQTTDDDVVKSGNVIADSRTPLVEAFVGMGVHHGAPKPDISTAEALKKTLLAAKFISYPTTASGAVAGFIFEAALKKMGIFEQVQPKIKMPPSGSGILDLIAKGETEICITFISEMDLPGIDVVGPLPKEVAPSTAYVAFVGAHAKDPAGARQLLAFISSKEAAPIYKSHHMSPAN